MLRTALRDDALTSAPGGFELRIGLPWIRSMPLAGVSDLAVTVDGDPVPAVRIALGDRRVRPEALADERAWWFVQDRLAIRGDRPLPAGRHTISVDFRLLVPYLQAGPDAPLVLPFHLEAELELDGVPVPSVSRDVA